MDYKKIGIQILELVGGASNVNKLTHCATRLRFEFNDMSKVETEKIKNLPGVISVVNKGGQFQVVVGNDVQQAYKAIIHEIGDLGSNNKTNKNKKEDSIVTRIISVISTVFTPMIPAITGAGMIKAILAILKLTGVLAADSQTYYLLDMISDAAFYFMPVLLAYGAAIKFECSPILVMTLAGILLHPSLGKLVAAGKPVHFLGLPVRLTDYSSTVLPIILTIWIMSYVENFAEKVSPSFIKFFTKPMIVLLVTAPLALIVIGPTGTYLNDAVAAGLEFVNLRASWLIPLLMGTFQPLLVVTGTAWSMTPIATMQLASKGFEMVNGPGMLASNIAQGGATLAVAFKTKNKNLRQLAASSGTTALLGITEPSLYGVTLKLKKPLIASMIGGGCAGIYAGLTGLVRYAFVSPGLTALPAFIGSNPMNIIHALVTCIIAFVVTFIMTLVIGFEDIQEEKQEIEVKESEVAVTVENKMNTENNNSIEKIASPLSGELVPLEEVKDEVFSSGAMGKGIAIIPNKGTVVAPFNGEVVTLLESKHAIGIKSDSGIEMLIHVGIDTVNLQGKYYTAYVKAGDKIKVGDKLIDFDMDAIKKLDYDTVTPVLILNPNEYSNIDIKEKRNVNLGDLIIKVK